MALHVISILYQSILFTDFDIKLPDKEIQYITRKMDKGFTGGNMETLRKNLHGFLRPKILNAKYFRKITKNGLLKYEICEKKSVDCMKLELGSDITCEDLAPLKITKEDILNELKKITVSEANVQMEKILKTLLKSVNKICTVKQA